MSVVISPALVVSPVSGRSRINPYIGWDNVVLFGNLESDEEAVGYPVTNLANPSTANRWWGTTNGAQTITVSDIESVTDYVAFTGHNFGTIGSEITVEGELSGVYSEIFSGVVPADNGTLMIEFEKAAYTSIRITVGAGSSPPYASVMFVGELIVVPTGISPSYTPISEGYNDETVGGRSVSGEFLGLIVVGSYLETRTPLKRLSRQWYESRMRPFIKAANRGDPFFFAWSPVLRPDQVGYCSFSSSVQPVISQSDGSYDVTLTMIGTAS